MLYRVCVCFCFATFFFSSLISFGGQIETTHEIRLDKKHNVLQEEESVVSCFAVCPRVSDRLAKIQIRRIENKNREKESEEIGWNAIRHRLLPPSLILQKSHFSSIFARRLAVIAAVIGPRRSAVEDDAVDDSPWLDHRDQSDPPPPPPGASRAT